MQMQSVGLHRSRKEKLICRSIVTSELVVPEDGTGPEEVEITLSTPDSSDLLYHPNHHSHPHHHHHHSHHHHHLPNSTGNSTHNSIKVNCTSSHSRTNSNKSSSKLNLNSNTNSNSSSSLPSTKSVKLKGPRKPRTPNHSPKFPTTPSPLSILSSDGTTSGTSGIGPPPSVVPTTNGTGDLHLHHGDDLDGGGSRSPGLKAQLPLSKKIKVQLLPSICGVESNGGTTTGTGTSPATSTTTNSNNSNSNGLLLNNNLSSQFSPSKPPSKPRKPRKRKTEKFNDTLSSTPDGTPTSPRPPTEPPRVKRKYTKRKLQVPYNTNSPTPIGSESKSIFSQSTSFSAYLSSSPNLSNIGFGSSPSCSSLNTSNMSSSSSAAALALLDELNRIPTELSSAFNREIEFRSRGSVSPRSSHSSVPSQESSPSRSPAFDKRRFGTGIDYHDHDSDELENSSTEDDCEGAELDVRESVNIPNNTHLLLSPVTLKRMLRTPSPSTLSLSIPPSQVPLVEDEVDEELMCNSNSLFRDLSINRQLKTPSPTGSSQYGGSLSSSGGGGTSTSPTSSRLRYSRRRFGRLYPPFDLARCAHSECTEKPLLGAKTCGLHMETTTSPIYGVCQYTEPISLKPCSQYAVGHDDREFRFCDAHSTRIATTRTRMNRVTRVVDNYQTVKDEIKKNLEVSIDEQCAVPSALSTTPESMDEPKEELSAEFNREIDLPLPQYGRNFKHYSKYQVDYESDEDVHDTDEHDPLGRAGYYSTDEVISIYRSKLEKLKHLYVGQFSSIKNAYMDYRVRYLAEKEKMKELHLHIQVILNI